MKISNAEDFLRFHISNSGYFFFASNRKDIEDTKWENVLSNIKEIYKTPSQPNKFIFIYHYNGEEYGAKDFSICGYHLLYMLGKSATGHQGYIYDLRDIKSDCSVVLPTNVKAQREIRKYFPRAYAIHSVQTLEECL